MNASGDATDRQLNERLASSGFRFTPHRQHVYDVLLRHRDHPTAEEVFIRVRGEVPEISMATVYNCLDALVKCGLARLVNVDRGATRFCPNMEEHGHFVCERCGEVFDIRLPLKAVGGGFEVPDGFRVSHFDLAVHGECRACAGQN